MQPVLNLYKPVSVTPLQLIEEFRKHYPAYHGVPMGYAGRLDPMADGVLIVLVGEENKQRKHYELLAKEYIAEFILGIRTDSYDLLGLITESTLSGKSFRYTKQLESIIPTFLGTHEQTYPPFSSINVQGKPLFKWAREGKLQGLPIPRKQVTISDLSLIPLEALSAQELHQMILTRITPLQGVFRQDSILHNWETFFRKNTTCSSFPRFQLHISCSSGTYIRSLVHEIGDKLGTGAVTVSITRTRVGHFLIADAVRI